MGSITIEQLGVFLGGLAGIIGSIEYLLIRLNKLFDNKLEPINEKIDYLDEGQSKNYMSRYLKDVENGISMDSTETERFWEIYDHYTKPKELGGLGLNSYFHKKVEKLQKEGKM